MSNPGRKCIFCQIQPGNSKEHLWGEWLLRLAKIPIRSSDRGSHTITGMDVLGEAKVIPGILRKPGHSLSITTRVVCRSCNNTWMSEIENGMADVYKKSFFVSNRSLPQIELDALNETLAQNDQAAVLTWIYLKFLLIEYAYPPESLAGVSSEAVRIVESARVRRRHSFFRTRELPSDFRIFISRSISVTNKLRYGSFNHLCAFIFSHPSNQISEVSSCLLEVGAFSAIITNQFPRNKSNPFQLPLHELSAPLFALRHTNGDIILPKQKFIYTETLDDKMTTLWKTSFPVATRKLAETIPNTPKIDNM